MVPNLGYAYPQGYVKSLKGYASLRITLRFSMKRLTHVRRGYASFIFSAWGYEKRKRLGTAALQDKKDFSNWFRLKVLSLLWIHSFRFCTFWSRGNLFPPIFSQYPPFPKEICKLMERAWQQEKFPIQLFRVKAGKIFFETLRPTSYWQ